MTCARGDLGVDQGIKLLIQHPWVSGLLSQQTLLEVRVRLVPVRGQKEFFEQREPQIGANITRIV